MSDQQRLIRLAVEGDSQARDELAREWMRSGDLQLACLLGDELLLRLWKGLSQHERRALDWAVWQDRKNRPSDMPKKWLIESSLIHERSELAAGRYSVDLRFDMPVPVWSGVIDLGLMTEGGPTALGWAVMFVGQKEREERYRKGTEMMYLVLDPTELTDFNYWVANEAGVTPCGFIFDPEMSEGS